ncbi:Acyltransferase family domain containing protein [Naviculisporaceae sp. PSN 640]
MHQLDGVMEGTRANGRGEISSWRSNPSPLGRLGSPLPSKGNPFRWVRLLSFSCWPRSNAAESSSSSKPIRPTAYLDGLRGFAAFLVYIHHHQLWAHGSTNYANAAVFENAFGWHDQFHFATFIGVRNFFTGGHMAVAVFYVISGYVLSAKPLALIQGEEYAKLTENLGSAFFRRWFRLYIPLLATTLVYLLSWHVFGYWNPVCEPKDTLREELWNWYVEFKNFSFLFKEGPVWVSYNTHLWSIPLEMRGSMITFIACLSLAKAPVKRRLISQIVLMFYFMYVVDGFYGALFIAGMLQCDLDLLYKRADGSFPRWLRRLERYKTFIYWHFFFISMWLAGVPSQTANVMDLRANPGWYWMSFLKPQAVYDPKWFYLFFAANMLVACIPRMQWLKRFFETRFCQFLGRISFSLYLVHGPILATLGDRLYHAVGYVRPFEDSKTHLAWWINLFPLPKVGPMGLEVSFLVPHLVLLPLTFWVADFVTRAVDEPAVRFPNWLYRKTVVAACERGAGSPEPKMDVHDDAAVALLRLA